MNKKVFVINGPVNGKTFEDAVNFVSEVVDFECKDILICINSIGGSLNHGLAIYDLFKALPYNITTVALGSCCSIATVLFSLGDKRFIGKNTKFLIHSCIYRNPENSEIKAYDLQQFMSEMKENNSKLINCYLSSKGFMLKRTQLEEFFDEKEDKIYTPDEAVKYGFATNIFEDIKDI